ncbi:hypothetical protein KSP39_PZI009816 [Platanthera zijinensis]|uniref:Uncharacterized protein n=1 Tax=Platanthera zijinensis TaxID=2320716 RepID=A0AAP0BHH3_9ASPA
MTMWFGSYRNAGMTSTSIVWTCASDLTLHVPPAATSSLWLSHPEPPPPPPPRGNLLLLGKNLADPLSLFASLSLSLSLSLTKESVAAAVWRGCRRRYCCVEGLPPPLLLCGRVAAAALFVEEGPPPSSCEDVTAAVSRLGKGRLPAAIWEETPSSERRRRSLGCRRAWP